MNKFLTFITALVLAFLIRACATHYAETYDSDTPLHILPTEDKAYGQEEPREAARDSVSASAKTESLQQFTEKLFLICGAKSVSARRGILIGQISRIAAERMSSRDRQEAYILLLCIESKYNPEARSKSGAVGMAQLVPRYAAEFADDCGMGKLGANDVYDTETNITVGACYFNLLLNHYNGSTAQALAAYNSGLDSPTVRRLGNIEDGHPETNGYLAKFYTLKERVK